LASNARLQIQTEIAKTEYSQQDKEDIASRFSDSVNLTYSMGKDNKRNILFKRGDYKETTILILLTQTHKIRKFYSQKKRKK